MERSGNQPDPANQCLLPLRASKSAVIWRRLIGPAPSSAGVLPNLRLERVMAEGQDSSGGAARRLLKRKGQ